jgi:hypothetical protein
MKLVTKYQISAINSFGPIRFLLPVCRLSWFLYTLNIYTHFSSHFSQQLYKCMLNVYKNQQNRQTGSRSLMGPKTLPTIWATYMKLVTKYQISAINSSKIFFVAFFSATIDDRNLIFGHKLHIGMPYCGKRF